MCYSFESRSIICPYSLTVCFAAISILLFISFSLGAVDLGASLTTGVLPPLFENMPLILSAIFFISRYYRGIFGKNQCFPQNKCGIYKDLGV